jgi:hypothetical protein
MLFLLAALYATDLCRDWDKASARLTRGTALYLVIILIS